MEGGDHFSVARLECGGKGTVGGGESCDRHAITGGGSGQVGNGVDSFLSIDMVGGVLADMIGGVVSGTRGGGLRLAQFLMGSGKNVFELVPGLVGWVPLFP